jgi:Zn-dependent peptidase ImmA (M78 family)
VLARSVRGTVYRWHFQVMEEQEELTQDVVLLNFDDADTDEEKTIIIAHEIAHAYLGHADQVANADAEREADDLIETWGFARSYGTIGGTTKTI